MSTLLIIVATAMMALAGVSVIFALLAQVTRKQCDAMRLLADTVAKGNERLSEKVSRGDEAVMDFVKEKFEKRYPFNSRVTLADMRANFQTICDREAEILHDVQQMQVKLEEMRNDVALMRPVVSFTAEERERLLHSIMGLKLTTTGRTEEESGERQPSIYGINVPLPREEEEVIDCTSMPQHYDPPVRSIKLPQDEAEEPDEAFVNDMMKADAADDGETERDGEA